MSSFEASINKSLGSRIRSARESAGLNQEFLAGKMGFRDRQTISDIENGKRSVKAEELVSLSDLLSKDIEFFLDPFVVAGEAEFSWRVSPDVNDESLKEFEATAGKIIGLLRWLRTQKKGGFSPLTSGLRLSTESSFEEAQRCGEEIAKQFMGGEVPANGLVAYMEQRLDLPVLFVDIPDQTNISGAFCHLAELGAILINRRESPRRRNFDLAHELFHCLTWERMKPAHREPNSPEPKDFGIRTSRRLEYRIERLADNFAAGLLMPTQILNTLLISERKEDPTHLFEVATKLQVNPQALGWRLYNLGWISSQARASLIYEKGPSEQTDTPRLLSRDLILLLNGALAEGLISPRKAAKTLGISLSDLVATFMTYGLPDPLEA